MVEFVWRKELDGLSGVREKSKGNSGVIVKLWTATRQLGAGRGLGGGLFVFRAYLWWGAKLHYNYRHIWTFNVA